MCTLNAGIKLRLDDSTTKICIRRERMLMVVSQSADRGCLLLDQRMEESCVTTLTRASDWTDSESNPIRIDEWLAYIGSDPEMRLDNFADAQTPAGSVIRYENAGVAVW